MLEQRTPADLDDVLPADAWELSQAIKKAVDQDDLPLLHRTMFQEATWPDGRKQRVLRPGVARTLLLGFGNQSFAELCFEQRRAHVLRDVLEAARPASVDGWPTVTNVEWMRFLCTRNVEGEWTRVSLLHTAALKPRPQSRDFIMLLLQVCRDASAIDKLASTAPAAGALIAECEMALRIRLPHGGATEREPSRAARRNPRCL